MPIAVGGRSGLDAERPYVGGIVTGGNEKFLKGRPRRKQVGTFRFGLGAAGVCGALELQAIAARAWPAGWLTKASALSCWGNCIRTAVLPVPSFFQLDEVTHYHGDLPVITGMI